MPSQMQYIDMIPEQVQLALEDEPGLQILDVRSEQEYRSHHLEGGELIPIDKLAGRLSELDPQASYLLVCEHGVRSAAACQFLHSRGFGDLRNLKGGLEQWKAEGLPMQTNSS